MGMSSRIGPTRQTTPNDVERPALAPGGYVAWLSPLVSDSTSSIDQVVARPESRRERAATSTSAGAVVVEPELNGGFGSYSMKS
jgi:hypothetical protein